MIEYRRGNDFDIVANSGNLTGLLVGVGPGVYPQIRGIVDIFAPETRGCELRTARRQAATHC